MSLAFVFTVGNNYGTPQLRRFCAPGRNSREFAILLGMSYGRFIWVLVDTRDLYYLLP